MLLDDIYHDMKKLDSSLYIFYVFREMSVSLNLFFFFSFSCIFVVSRIRLLYVQSCGVNANCLGTAIILIFNISDFGWLI